MHPQPTLLFVLSMLLTSVAWAGPLSAIVDRVKDGDTLLVTINGKQEQLQLTGIDAPEDVPNPKLKRDMEHTKLGQEQLIAIGKLATAHLETLAVPGQAIEIEVNLNKRDRYGRIPAIARNGSGRNINLAMVEDGYAVVMGRYQFDTKMKAELQQHQEKAISDKLGLWGSHPETTKAWGGK